MMNSYISRAGRSLRTFWAAGLSLVALCVFSVSSSWGQLAIRYDFATSSGTYSSISGTGTSVSILGDDLSFNITGLSPGFTVNGTTYTNARMNSNGWLALYTATAPTSTTLYSPLSTALANGAVIIAPFGRDQNGTGAAAWRQTIGNEHIFEWQNFYRFGTSGESLNYQIRLNTATGQISFVYGSFVSSANSTYPQVGWKTNGTTGSNWATDVNNLMLDVIGSPNSCNWSNVVTGNTNTTTLYLNNANSGVAPTSGLTYTWTPQNAVSPVRTFAAVTGITIDGATVSWTAPAGATQYDVQYRIPGSCTWTNWSGNPVLTNTVSLTGLASGTSYQVRVRASNGTNNAIYSHIPNTAGTGSGYNATGTFTTSTPVCTTLGSLTAGTVSSTANPACNGVNFTLSTTGSTTGFGGLTYQWYSSPDNITYTPIGGATGATYVTNITASTWFQREIICSGGPASQFTPGLLITLDVPTNCYCIPGYTSGKTDGDLISQVTIPTTTLNNNTGTSPTNPAFTFFAPNPPSNTTTASLQAGTSYNVQVTYGSFTGQNCAAWVDFNGDGVFSTPSERIGFTTAGSTIAFQQVSFPISIPCNPTPGNYRLRIRDVWNTAGNAIDPCATYGWGETEDYIITITPPDPCPQPSGLALTSVAGTSASISWNVGCVETAWQAVVVPAGNLPGTGTPQNVAVTNATFSGLTTGTAYDAYVRADCLGNGFSSWIGPINFTPNFLVPLSGNVTYGGEICGAVLYDHAGPSADYSNNANGTVELAPANAGDVVQISGTYNVEGCCDNLIIYEGAGTGGAVLFDNISSASGTVNVVSNVPGGTVTVQFTSDVSAVFAGFALNINCVAPPACGSITGLVATPSGLTAALNWNDVPSAINYQWEVVPQGNAQGVGVVTSGSSATSDASVTSNLSPLTAYTAYVRSECSGGFGLWFSVNFTSGIANDLCSGAIVVGCGASVNGSTTTLNGATNDLMPTQCGAASPDGAQTANGVWYRYAGNDQTVTASLCGSGYDSRISIYTGSCGTLTCVAGNDDACGLQSEVSFNAFAGDDYYIMVHGFGGSTGTFTLNITCDELCFTPNDDCATAQPITINTNGTGNPYTQNNECSLLSSFPNATCGGTFSQHTDEWFSFNNGLRDSLHFAILPVAPAPITGSYFAALYSGTCGTPTLIGCAGPVNVGVDGTFWLTGTPANTDYLLRIYRSSSNVATGGDYTIAVSGEALCTGVPAPGATTTTASVVCPGQPFNIAVSNNLPGGISYVYQSGPSAVGPWTTIFTGIQSEIIVPTQSVNTWYRVRANCLTSGQTGIATPVQVAMSPVCYPVPSSPTSPADTEIFSTTVGSGIQGSDCVTAAPGAGSVLGEYSSYLNQPSLTNLVRGGSAGFDIAVNSCGGFFGSKVAIYVDFDQSGTFEAGEEVYEDAASSTGPNNRTGSFNIPVGAPLGQTGMRVILAEVGSFTDITPSLVFTWGEVEDYIVNIVNPAAANDFIGLAQPITSGAFPTCSAAATANLPVASDSPETVGVGNDVWYSFVATTNAVRIAVTGGAAPHNTQIELRDGVGVIATENDNTANGDETMIVDNLTAGNTYFVGVTQLGGSATATVCISHLRRSTCNNPTTFNSPCASYKSQFTSANSYTVYFDDDGVSPFVATATSNNGITTIPLSAFTTLPPMTSTQVYQVRVDATYNLPDAAGNITTAVVPGLFNCTRTVNPHAGVFLRDSDASPNVKPANALVAANAWLCGSLFYEWTVQQYDAIGGNAVAPVPTVVNGAPVNRFLNLTGLGLVPNGIYKVNVRPVFASGPGNLGPDRWLIIAGPAPMILDENQAQAFEKNGTEATIESALYPNPSNGSFVNLNITGVEANVMVRVLDGMGRVVWTNNLVVEGSLNTIIAFERPLASGLYTVEMTYDGKVVTERLMVQK